MRLLFRYFKKAEKNKNRIIIPRYLIQNYGREYYLEIYDDDTIKLVPIKKKED